MSKQSVLVNSIQETVKNTASGKTPYLSLHLGSLKLFCLFIVLLFSLHSAKHSSTSLMNIMSLASHQKHVRVHTVCLVSRSTDNDEENMPWAVLRILSKLLCSAVLSVGGLIGV